jgi:hypothetical protein
VLEVCHGSWVDESILDLLAELGVGICNIDQPSSADPSSPRPP